MVIENLIKRYNKKVNKMKYNPIVYDESIRKALELGGKKRTTTMSDEIVEIFKAAKAAGQNEIGLKEITGAYYNAFTKPNNGSLKARHRIAQQVFNMQKSEKCCIEKVPGKRGLYRLK